MYHPEYHLKVFFLSTNRHKKFPSNVASFWVFSSLIGTFCKLFDVSRKDASLSKRLLTQSHPGLASLPYFREPNMSAFDSSSYRVSVSFIWSSFGSGHAHEPGAQPGNGRVAKLLQARLPGSTCGPCHWASAQYCLVSPLSLLLDRPSQKVDLIQSHFASWYT